MILYFAYVSGGGGRQVLVTIHALSERLEDLTHANGTNSQCGLTLDQHFAHRQLNITCIWQPLYASIIS